MSVYLRSERASTFGRLRRASPTAPLSPCRIPPRSPQGLSPTAERAGCPRVALPRASPTPLADQPQRLRCNTEALLQSLRLLAQILCESYAAKAARKTKAMPVAQTRPAPRLARPRPERFLSRYREQRAIPLSIRRRDFTYAVQGLLARSSLRSTLSLYGFISLGFSKKYSVGYEAVCRSLSSVSMM